MSKSNKKIYLLTDRNRGKDFGFEFQKILDGLDSEVIYGSISNNTVEHIIKSRPDLVLFHISGHHEQFFKLITRLRAIKTTPIIALLNEDSIVSNQNAVSLEDVTTLPDTISNIEFSSIVEEKLNPKVAIKFWGVRGSTPCANKENMEYGGNTTCIQIELPNSDHVLILDSGTGIRNLGNHLSDLQKEIKARIFITHPHWDHIQGFPFFKPIFGASNQLSIHMPGQLNGGCKEILSGHLTKTFFPVSLQMIDASIDYVTQTEQRQQYEGYEVEYMLANHPINTAIYKIHIEGRKIVFCPDNELIPIAEKTSSYFNKKLKKFFDEADVLIHDAQYDQEGYKKREGWGHSAWEEVVQFAMSANVKNLFLTHHDPDSDDAYLDSLNDQLQRNFSEHFHSVQLAREGERVPF